MIPRGRFQKLCEFSTLLKKKKKVIFVFCFLALFSWELFLLACTHIASSKTVVSKFCASEYAIVQHFRRVPDISYRRKHAGSFTLFFKSNNTLSFTSKQCPAYKYTRAFKGLGNLCTGVLCNKQTSKYRQRKQM